MRHFTTHHLHAKNALDETQKGERKSGNKPSIPPNDGYNRHFKKHHNGNRLFGTILSVVGKTTAKAYFGAKVLISTIQSQGSV